MTGKHRWKREKHAREIRSEHAHSEEIKQFCIDRSNHKETIFYREGDGRVFMKVVSTN
jgi:hypothetical protein